MWKWNDMVDYLITPSEKKPADTPHLDSYPYFFGVLPNDELCDRGNIYDEEADPNADTQDTIMESMAQLAKDGHKLDSAILKASAYAQDNRHYMYSRLIDYYKTQPCKKPRFG